MHPLVWDENSFVPRVLGVAGSSMPSVQGASATGGVPVLPDSLVGVSAASGVVLGSSGFEVLGARVVDSRVARFTAPDSLAAPVGAGWGADRFSLVGGNPVLLVDPWGLSPVSVEDFEKYREQKVASGGWLQNNWEYLAGGAMVIAGAVIGAVGTGLGPLGGAAFGAASGALMGAGMSVIEQKMSGGKVDWSKAGKEALKGAITGAITGAVTGGLGNLKKVADIASKMKEVEKVSEIAQTTSKLAKMKQAASVAVSKVTTPIKSVVSPYARKAGAMLNDCKALEDVVKDSTTGGLNNVVSYYMDDNVKDKSLLGATGMFFSGAGASMVGSLAGGYMKYKSGIKGYVPEPPEKLKGVQPVVRKNVQKPLLVRAGRRTVEIARDSAIDATSGTIKNGLQYYSDSPIKGQPVSLRGLKENTVDGWSKDFAKSSVKGMTKMDAGRANYYRFTAAHTYNQVMGNFYF